METTKTLNTAFSLASAIELNAERPVYNQLMKTKFGGANLVGLHAGQKLDEHLAPGAVLIYVIEGCVDFTIECNLVHLDTGDSVMMEAGTPHSVSALSDTKILLVKIDN